MRAKARLQGQAVFVQTHTNNSCVVLPPTAAAAAAAKESVTVCLSMAPGLECGAVSTDCPHNFTHVPCIVGCTSRYSQHVEQTPPPLPSSTAPSPSPCVLLPGCPAGPSTHQGRTTARTGRTHTQPGTTGTRVCVGGRGGAGRTADSQGTRLCLALLEQSSSSGGLCMLCTSTADCICCCCDDAGAVAAGATNDAAAAAASVLLLELSTHATPPHLHLCV